jgi:hypothetical protein
MENKKGKKEKEVKEIVVKEQQQPDLIMGEDSVKKATSIANNLSEIINKQKLFAIIKNKKYVMVEGWNTLGAMMGVFPDVVSCERMEAKDPKEIKYSAIVRLKTPQGNVITTAQAICSNSEMSKRNDAEYSISSMAQTRATGKAFRLAFSWIMSMAGYEPITLEEMSNYNNSLDHKTMEKIDKINSLEELDKYYQNNKGMGKDHSKYLMEKKNQLESQPKTSSEPQEGDFSGVNSQKGINTSKPKIAQVKSFINKCEVDSELEETKRRIEDEKPFSDEENKELLELISAKRDELSIFEALDKSEKVVDVDELSK